MRAILALVLLASVAAAKDPPDPKAEDRKKAEELLKGSETLKGFFLLHRKDDKVLAELGREDFDRSFLIFESIARGIGRGRILGGMTLSDRIVRFRKITDDRIQLVEENPRFRAAEGSPLSRAVGHAYGPSVLANFKVEARHPDRETWIIDLGELFLTDLPSIAEWLGRTLSGSYRHDQKSSTWVKAKSFPKNCELQTALVFSSSKYDDVETIPDPRSVEIRVHYSLHELPRDDSFRPRRADDRVGYFLTVVKDFSEPGLTSFVRYANRFHIEKADPEAEISAPRNPLVFWIENTVPFEYRRYVREGILEWNKAFLKIGIRDAIEVRQMEEDALWDPEDARYNTFRWITSSRLSFGAMGPSRVDPRTGRILDADILYESENLRGLRWGFLRNQGPRTEVPFLLEKAAEKAGRFRGFCELAKMRAPEHALAHLSLTLLGAPETDGGMKEEYIAQAIRETVMHEVGHTLGLRHNFKASTMLTLDQLHRKELTAEKGLMGSVMEYNSVNLALDPEKQGHFYSPTLGPYDYWAIEYGYKPIPAEREAQELERIASRCDEPGLQYATDEDTYGTRNIDPTATVFDMGKDPLSWCEQRIQLCENLWAADWKALQVKGYGYRLYRAAMSSLLRNYRRALEISARWVGGTYMNRRHPGDEGTPFRNVPVEKQRRALGIVVEKGLAKGLFRFEPELLNLLAVSRWRHWGTDPQDEFEYPLRAEVRSLRRALLNRLHHPAVLRHIYEAEARALPDEPPMTVGEVLGEVSDAVWSDVGEGKVRIPPMRRDLQVDHVESLARLALRGSGAPEDARSIARLRLKGIRSTVNAPLVDRRVGHEETRAHLERIRDRIDQVLEAKLTVR